MRHAYSAFEVLIAPARPSATPLRLFLGLMMCVILFVTFVMLAQAALGAVLSQSVIASLDQSLSTGSDPVGVLANLGIFGFIIVALQITLHNVHNRSLRSIIGPTSLAIAQFRRTLLYLVALYVALMILMPADPALPVEANMAFGQWLYFLPLALPALLIQTGAEEMVFRGYMQSQLAARFVRPWIWLLVPSVIFGFLHHDPAIHGGNAMLVVLWATGFGLAAADLTARAGTIGPAVALHFMNNFSAIFIAAPEGYFDGLALYSYPFSLDDSDIASSLGLTEAMMLLVSWLTVRVALRH